MISLSSLEQLGSMSTLTWGLSSSYNRTAVGAGVKWTQNKAGHLKWLFTHKFSTSAGMARIAKSCVCFSLRFHCLWVWIAWPSSQHHGLKIVGFFFNLQLVSHCVNNPRGPRRSWKVSFNLGLQQHLLYIALVKSWSWDPPRFKGRGWHKRVSAENPESLGAQLWRPVP